MIEKMLKLQIYKNIQNREYSCKISTKDWRLHAYKVHLEKWFDGLSHRASVYCNQYIMITPYRNFSHVYAKWAMQRP